MSIVTKIGEVVAVINELATLKAALGIPDHATLGDVIAEIKQLGTALGLVSAAAPVAGEVATVAGEVEAAAETVKS